MGFRNQASVSQIRSRWTEHPCLTWPDPMDMTFSRMDSVASNNLWGQMNFVAMVIRRKSIWEFHWEGVWDPSDLASFFLQFPKLQNLCAHISQHFWSEHTSELRGGTKLERSNNFISLMETFEINQYFQSSQSAITSAAWEKKNAN